MVVRDLTQQRPRPAAALLRPILDMFMDSPVAIVGCHSKGIQRGTCEYDIVVVTNDVRPRATMKIGGSFVDMSFTSEHEALSPSNPEYAVSMATAKPVRDSGLILSTSSAANSAIQEESAKRAAAKRLASSLKTLGRTEDAISSEATRESDFWLMASAYEFAYAWLYSRSMIPSPSHLLSQLKSISMGSPKRFEAISKGAGLERATRVGSGSRLDGLVVLNDIVQGSSRRKATRASSWSKARIDSLRAKAQDLASRIELAECYSFMGQEIVDHLMALTSRDSVGSMTLSDLFSGEEPLLSDRLLRGLGLSRSLPVQKQALAPLRDEVSDLARVL